jgi:hypothetical protein
MTFTKIVVVVCVNSAFYWNVAALETLTSSKLSQKWNCQSELRDGSTRCALRGQGIGNGAEVLGKRKYKQRTRDKEKGSKIVKYWVRRMFFPVERNSTLNYRRRSLVNPEWNEMGIRCNAAKPRIYDPRRWSSDIGVQSVECNALSVFIRVPKLLSSYVMLLH